MDPSTTTKSGSGEMGRLYDGLHTQADLLVTLKEKLAVVSNAVPEESTESIPGRTHISEAAYVLEENNRKISALIDNLVL